MDTTTKMKRPKRPETINLHIGGTRKTQSKIWKACVDYAISEHERASAVMYDNNWLGNVNKMGLEWLYRTIKETVEETALAHYRYWHMRVHSPGAYGFGSLDPAQARAWTEAGGTIEKMHAKVSHDHT